jgi:hypothetical protein
MSLNRASLCLIAAFLSLDTALASEIHCPSIQRIQGKSQPLDSASVFSGPPEELAELMPDLETSEWDLARDQQAAKERSQSLYFVCRYKNSKRTVSLPIPRDAALCKVEGMVSGATAAWCKSGASQSVKSNAKGAHGHQS